MQVLESKKPYDRFVDAIDNPKTRREYLSCLRLFMEHHQVTGYDELLKLNTVQIEDIIINYILFMKNEKGLSEGLITQRASALRMFFSANRINLNWDFINRHKGKFKKKQKLEAYNHEQIHRLLEISNHRTRCIVLIFSSTGIRIGALPELRLKHLKKMGNLYQFTIYENEEEEYITFCTPECATAIDNYLAYRKRSGEVITQESYLIRNEFDSEDLEQVRSNSAPISSSTIRNVMSKLLIKAGLRKLEHEVDTTHRKQIPIDHGYRMFFTSQLVNAKLQPELRWLLEGHALKASDKSYVRVKDQLHYEYLKAINNLTINPENRLREQVKSLEADRDEITLMKLEHRQHMKEMRQEMETKFSQILAKIDINKLS
jgi:integrase